MSYEVTAETSIEQQAPEIDQRFLEAAATMTRLTGLGVQELSQPINYNGNSGTLLDAMQDEKCPVGGWFKEAHAADQHAISEGVQEPNEQRNVAQKLLGVSMLMGLEKPITISEQTAALNRGDIHLKDMYGSIERPQQEKPDFLA